MNENREELSVDLESLLTPISAERPSGESLRYEGTYDRVQEMRREDDPSLPQGIWRTSLKRADWDAVRALCLEALETRTKDLQIAAWLVEAWIQLHGFPGAREGLRMMAGLCEAFWEDLYPELDGDDVEYRVAPVEWVNEKLSDSLKLIPITRPRAGDAPAYSWGDSESALHLETLARRDPTVLRGTEEAGRPTVVKFRESVMLTPKPFFVSLFAELSSVLDAAVAFERLLEERCGNRAPLLYQFKEVIMGIQRLVTTVLQEREGEEDDASEEEGYTDEQDGSLPAEKGAFSTGPIRSRAQAYQMLSEIADYLSRVEPHSPSPYLIRRAVGWGSMTLLELLQELVQDANDLRMIYSLLGIKEGGIEL